jgi:hypothetical protein
MVKTPVGDSQYGPCNQCDTPREWQPYSAGLMPPELSRVVRAMWDPHDQKRPTFLKIIELLEPIAQKYQVGGCTT